MAVQRVSSVRCAQFCRESTAESWYVSDREVLKQDRYACITYCVRRGGRQAPWRRMTACWFDQRCSEIWARSSHKSPRRSASCTDILGKSSHLSGFAYSSLKVEADVPVVELVLLHERVALAVKATLGEHAIFGRHFQQRPTGRVLYVKKWSLLNVVPLPRQENRKTSTSRVSEILL